LIWKINSFQIVFRQAWQEYRYGINGCWALQTLDSRFGYSWRSEDTERKYYSRRKPIFEAVQRLLDGGMTEDMAIMQLEQQRGSCSLHSLCQSLRQQR
jgi:hypothetical protein